MDMINKKILESKIHESLKETLSSEGELLELSFMTTIKMAENVAEMIINSRETQRIITEYDKR